ncbi:MAG: L,D-transpeptidase family protein, partial [Verrucomicrobiota bacterium]
VAQRSSGGGFFSRMAIGTPSKYKSEGHDIYVNQRLLASLNSSNAKIEIDLSEQKARIYQTGGGSKNLVIETSISSGKSGHTTPTGSYRIKEKLVHKRSTLYGTWMNSSGATVRSSGDSRQRPYGGSRFVGAEMPYWMRITGGIGMHIGYVPNHPASHGCIRVPSAIQPLIYSKVGVGTPVTIKR